MPVYDSAIINGTLVLPYQGTMRGHLGTKNGKISFLGMDDPSPEADEVIDAEGKFVFPGLIDPHVHMGNNLPFMQDFKNEPKSAAAGGVTTIMIFLKIGLFADLGDSYFKIFDGLLQDLEGLSPVDYTFHFHIPHEKYADEIPLYYERLGIQSFKFHMTYKPKSVQDSTTHLQKMSPGLDDGAIYALLKKMGKLTSPPLMMVHCECDEVISHTTEEAKEAGLDGLVAWDAARPDFTEELAVSRLAAIARHTGARVYVVHTSSQKALDVIREEKRKNTDILAETCPHYLWLTTDQKGTLGKVSPPIRSRQNIEPLWEGIRHGTVNCIGNDHGAKYKETKVENIWDATLGFPGLETMLPLMITGALDRQMPLERVAEVCSFNTARAFGLYPRKGNIAIGADADLVIVDVGEKRRVDPANFHSQADFTPFEGIELSGWPVTTIVRGKKVFDQGEFMNDDMGSFLPRFP